MCVANVELKKIACAESYVEIPFNNNKNVHRTQPCVMCFN